MGDALNHLFAPKVWYVVFGPARPKLALPWGLRRLAQAVVHGLPINRQHCWAFTMSRDGWLAVYPGLDGLAVAEAGANLLAVLKSIPERQITILLVNERRPGAMRVNWTCARTIAGLLGARKFRGLLPVQLCQYLINHHQAEVIHGRINGS